MKTGNSKSKETGMGLFAAAVVILTTVATFNAYGATFENRLMATTGMSSIAGYLAEANEAEAKMEEWMLDKNNFFLDYSLETAVEEPLAMESWMTESNLFPAIADLEKESEELLQLEDWMVNDSLFTVLAEAKTDQETPAREETVKVKKVIGVTFEKVQFGRRAFIIIEEEDPQLNMEQWMVDYRYWRKK